MSLPRWWPRTTWPRRSARCIYCGTRTSAQWQLTCWRHHDLIALDPHYTP